MTAIHIRGAAARLGLFLGLIMAGVAGATPHGQPVRMAAPRLMVIHAWVSPAPRGAQAAAGYLTIINHGRGGDQLLSVSTPAAQRVELHQSSILNGVVTTRPVDALAVKPGETVQLTPDGDRLMLIGLKYPFLAGRHIPAILKFQRSGSVVIQFRVLGPPKARSAHGPRHHRR